MVEDSIFEKVVSERLGCGWIIFKDGSCTNIYLESKDSFVSREEFHQEGLNLLAKKKDALRRVSGLDLK